MDWTRRKKLPEPGAVRIRDERESDQPAISALISDAFRSAPHSGGNEAAIVDALRADGALSLSLVAEREGGVLGHVAFSPVTIDGVHEGWPGIGWPGIGWPETRWYGLGPVAVQPDAQRQGIGAALIRAGIERLKAMGALGCVVLGDPAFYGRFGFRTDPSMVLPEVPPEYFQALRLTDHSATGTVAFHPAFNG